MFFPPYVWCFLAKNQKFLKVGKVRKFYEESVCSRKKRFHLLKSLLYKNGKAQNMPVVTGRLVNCFFQLTSSLEFESVILSWIFSKRFSGVFLSFVFFVFFSHCLKEVVMVQMDITQTIFFEKISRNWFKNTIVTTRQAYLFLNIQTFQKWIEWSCKNLNNIIRQTFQDLLILPAF